jgi:hypothetical protein
MVVTPDARTRWHLITVLVMTIFFHIYQMGSNGVDAHDINNVNNNNDDNFVVDESSSSRSTPPATTTETHTFDELFHDLAMEQDIDRNTNDNNDIDDDSLTIIPIPPHNFTIWTLYNDNRRVVRIQLSRLS